MKQFIKKQYDIELCEPKSSFSIDGTNRKQYLIHISSPKYSKLLVIQTEPEQKFWLKNKEISLEKLMQVLHEAKND